METLRGHKYLLRSSAQLEVHSSKSPAIYSCQHVGDEGIGTVSQGTNTRRRTKKATTNQLSEDVVTEILLRLPVKSLVRFKCVCKHWYDLIRSPHFVTTHYKITSLKKKVPISFGYDRDPYIHHCPITVSFRFSDVTVEFKLDIPDRSEPLLVGCYNGLVCLCLSHRTHDEFLLWNPATTQSRTIRITGLKTITQYYSALCFDSAANTHKIVRIRFFLKEKKFVNMTVPVDKVYIIAYVYTVTKGSWRTKKLFAPCRFPDGGHMSEVTHLMKFMCWMVSGYHDKYILCLDMVDVEFKIIELPSADHIYCVTELFNYKGSIALRVWEKPASDSCGGCCFDLWVLNDYGGTHQSWCKQFTWTPEMPDVEPSSFIYSESLASVY